MTAFPRRPPVPPAPSRRAAPWPIVAVLAVVGLSVALGVAVAQGVDVPSADSTALIPTGEVNDMGMPVVETPGAATGQAVAATVEVTGADWALGQVPLNTAVRPTWVIRNTGSEPVVLGEPHPEVREGCCPGPFTVADRTIPPGGETTLSFELSMHPGMDGWHDIAVHVPVAGPVGDAALALSVTGDFRDV